MTKAIPGARVCLDCEPLCIRLDARRKQPHHLVRDDFAERGTRSTPTHTAIGALMAGWLR